MSTLRTCLWLNKLPTLKLDPAKSFPPRYWCPKCKRVHAKETAEWFRTPTAPFGTCPVCSEKMRPRWSNQTDSGQNKLTPSDTRWKDRSRTYEGIAAAMAEQWAPFIT